MRRSLLPLIAFLAIGCGDTLPQLLNEAAQTKAEFADRLRLVVDEETCKQHFKPAKKQFDDRFKDVVERIDKIADNVGLVSLENAYRKKKDDTTQNQLKKAFGDDWLAGVYEARNYFAARKEFNTQIELVDARMWREQSRCVRLLSTVRKKGEPSQNLQAMHDAFLAWTKSKDRSLVFTLLEDLPPTSAFLPPNYLDYVESSISLPKTPSYVGMPPSTFIDNWEEWVRQNKKSKKK
ncbi:MAG: hypothetical protein K2X38_16380 [Gemmataceae bacterium]|nr:hypothetical protein [Gemmataceae bacterium]